jgi:hypothetical protein
MKLLRWKFRLFPLLVFLVSRTRFLSRLIGISSLCRCVCRCWFTVPLTAPISKGAYVTGLADLTADRLSFSYRSQTNAFFILLYVRMDDNGFRHPHSRKPDLLSLVTASSQFRGDLAYVPAPSIAYPSPFCPTFLPGR